MSFSELQILLFAQIGIDIALIVVFLALLRRMRDPKGERRLDKEVRLFESLLVEADNTTQNFKDRLEEKHHLIRSLNEQLDKRILSLHVLLNRAEVLLSRNRMNAHGHTGPLGHESRRAEILEFAKQGYEAEHIAKKLSIPKGEVKLVLDMRGKITQHKR